MGEGVPQSAAPAAEAADGDASTPAAVFEVNHTQLRKKYPRNLFNILLNNDILTTLVGAENDIPSPLPELDEGEENGAPPEGSIGAALTPSLALQPKTTTLVGSLGHWQKDMRRPLVPAPGTPSSENRSTSATLRRD